MVILEFPSKVGLNCTQRLALLLRRNAEIFPARVAVLSVARQRFMPNYWESQVNVGTDLRLLPDFRNARRMQAVQAENEI